MLVASALLALWVLSLAGAFLAYQLHDAHRRELHSAELLARSLEDQANRTFNAVDVTLTALAEHLGQAPPGADTARQNDRLRQALQGLPVLRSLSVVDAQGQVLHSSSPDNMGHRLDPALAPRPLPGALDRLGPLLPGRDLANVPYPATAAVSAAAPTPHHFLPLTRVLPAHKGPARYLVAALNPDYFANEYPLMLGDGGRAAALLTVQGALLSASDGIALNSPPPTAHAFFTDFLPARESGSFVGQGLGGREVVTAFRTLRQRPLVVVVERDHAQVLAEWRHTAGWVATACLVALALIAGLALAAWRSLIGHARVQAALRQSEQDVAAQLVFSARLLEASPTPVFVKDHAGRLVMVNQAWLTLMGFARDEVIGRDAAALFGPAAAVHTMYDQRLLKSEEPARYESRLERPGNPPRDTVVTKVRFTDAQGQPAGLVGSIVDVTEFREAERSIRLGKDTAERAQRAQAEFIAHVSHELRTPLQSILGYSELGEAMANPHPALQDMFIDIHAGGQRMLRLVNGLLDLAKMDRAADALSLQPCALAPLVHDVVKELRPIAQRHRVTVDWRVETAPSATGGCGGPDDTGPPLTLMADPFRLQQVLRNVLANALHHSPEGSTVGLYGGLRADGALELRVTDRGPGIPPGELERIFDTFAQSSRPGPRPGGTGLGLTISRRIVLAHGGSIHATHRPGGGAEIVTVLPASAVLSWPPPPERCVERAVESAGCATA